MARGRDAIVIDFFNIRSGPITADPATLEIGLVFVKYVKKTNQRTSASGKSSSMKSMGVFQFISRHCPSEIPGAVSWLRRAVREIRHILLGCDCEQCETAAVLAALLLRFARLDVEISGTGLRNALALRRHAYALVVAERLAPALPECKPNAK